MLQDELAKALDISKGYLSKLIQRGCPADDVGRAKTWISQHVRPRTKRTKAAADPAGVTAQDIPPAEQPAPEACYTIEARLERARRMEIAIYEATKLAINKKEYGQLQSLLASYQRALQGIAEAESTALDARKESGELIHRETVRAVLAELIVPIRNALDLLPVTERSRCNPADPKTAEGALRAWKDALLLKVSQAATKF